MDRKEFITCIPALILLPHPLLNLINTKTRNTRLLRYMNGLNTQSLICCIDSSGSIDNSDIKKFTEIILSSIGYFKKLRILVHGMDISQEFVLNNEPTQDVLKDLREIQGYGGTSHKAVFDRIETLNQEELISAVIFLTDFFSDVEQIYNEFKWIKEVPSVWVLIPNWVTPSDDTRNIVLRGCETRTIHIKDL